MILQILIYDFCAYPYFNNEFILLSYVPVELLYCITNKKMKNKKKSFKLYLDDYYSQIFVFDELE